MAGTGKIELVNFHLMYLLGSPSNGLRGMLDVPLHGRALRARNRVVAILRERGSDQEANRIAILKELAEKDEKGEPKMKADKSGFDLTPENLAKFQQQYNELLNEPMVLDVLPSNADDLRLALDVLRNTTVDMDIKTSEVWEFVIAAFEKGLIKQADEAKADEAKAEAAPAGETGSGAAA